MHSFSCQDILSIAWNRGDIDDEKNCRIVCGDGSGLGQTDIGNKAAIGGIAREFYQRMRKHYQQPTAWKWQKAPQYADSGQTRTEKAETAMWTFEPGAALKIIHDLVREAGVDVIYGERLDRQKGVRKEGPKIVAIVMKSGRAFAGPGECSSTRPTKAT